MGGGGGCCVGDFCFDCCIGEAFKSLFRGSSGGGGCGYHPGPSENEVHAKKIAGELEDMKKNKGESSAEIESQIADELTKTTNAFLAELRNINDRSFGSVKLKLDINSIQQEIEKLKETIPGTIGDHLNKRLILTDNELSAILEERDDKKRGKNFDAFVKRIEKESVDALKNKIRATLNKQEKLLTDAINARITEVEKSSAETLDTLAQITSLKQSGDGKAEEQKLESEYKHEIGCMVKELIKN